MTAHPWETLPKLLHLIEAYAAGRREEVERGRETPELAALLVQKYGYGVWDAAKVLYEAPEVAQQLLQTVDAAVAALDPAWATHARQRWASQAALHVAAPPAAVGIVLT